MLTKPTQKDTTKTSGRKQVSVRVEPILYQALAAFAHQERRTVSQAVRQLIEEGLKQHRAIQEEVDDTSSQEIARLAAAGGAFDWLAEEPELYDDTCGEPL